MNRLFCGKNQPFGIFQKTSVENLVKALRDLNVPEDIIAEAGAIVESTRTDVLCR